MTKIKLLTILSFVFIIAAFWFFLRLPDPDITFLRGSSISIIDRFQNSFVERTHLKGRVKRVTGEHLTNGWEKFAQIDSLTIWRTFSNSEIIPGSENPKLRDEKGSYVFESNLVHRNMKEGRWAYDGNQVFLTTGPAANPNRTSYYLDYTTLLHSQIQQISGENATPRMLGIHRPGERGSWIVFFPQHPIFIQKVQPLSPDIVLKKDGKRVPSEEWNWQPDSNVELFHASAVGVLRIFSAADKYDQEFYLKGGPLSVRVVAKGEMAGTEFPRLGIYIDDQKIGAIEVRSAEEKPYELNALITEGLHHVKIFFENDYANPGKNEDRNVDISEIALVYKSALILNRASSSDASSRYTIDYSTHDWQADLYYQAFLNRRGGGREPIDSITGNVEMQKEERRSLIFGSGDRVRIPVIVPKDGLLKFSYGFQWPDGPAPQGQFLIRARQAFHLPTILFSKKLDQKPIWTDASIDLAKWAGKKVALSFESIPSNINDSSPFLTFVGNPLIESKTSSSSGSKFVLLISFDALRADHLGVYGYKRPTSPNIDAFAHDAVVFENALTTVTWTLPSFTSLFTSLYPDFHNVVMMQSFLPVSFQTLPVILKQNGFYTIGFVDSPLLYPVYGLSRGFDSYNYDITEVEERSRSLLNWIDSCSSGNHFVFVHLISPHSPYTASDRYLHRLVSDYTPNISLSRQQDLERTDRPCGKLSDRELQDLILLYDAEILQLDEIFQHIVEHLKKKNLYDEATIVLMSDHGEEFQEHNFLFHGKSVFQETAHVPLIIKFPRSDPKLRGLRIADRVQLIDVMPTLLDVYHVVQKPWMQGRSLFRPLIAGQLRRVEERTFFIQNSSGILGIVRGPYKYIHTARGMLGLFCRPPKEEEIYDLEKDPGETKDISAERPDLISAFRKQYAIYEKQSAAFRKSFQRPGQTQTIELDTNTREQLRALGYIQ